MADGTMVASSTVAAAPAYVSPAPAALVDQDVATIYLVVARPKWADAAATILPALTAAGLCVDVLTSVAPVMAVHASSGALAAATAPSGEGDIYVRITAPEARLLREASRIQFRLPLSSTMLRAIDEERNLSERLSKYEGSSAIPTLPEGLDPYSLIFASLPVKGALPEVTRNTLLTVLGRTAHDGKLSLSDEELALRLLARHGTDGVRILSDVSALKLMRSIICASTEVEGAGLDLGALSSHGAIKVAFAGHNYAAREAVIAASTASVWDSRSYGIGVIFHTLAKSFGGARKKVETTGGAERTALVGSILGRAVDEHAPEGEHDRVSHYMRGYFGESVAFLFAFNEFSQASIMLLALCGVCVFANQQAVGIVEVPYLPAYAFLAAFWGLAFLEFWRRRQGDAVLRWGTGGAKNSEPLRSAYKEALHTSVIRSPVTGMWTYHAQEASQTLRFSISLAITVAAMAGCVAVIIGIFFLRLFIIKRIGATGDTATVLINSAWIGIGNALWTLVSTRLTDLETQSTNSAYRTSNIFKASLFRILNTYFSLLYIALEIGSKITVDGLKDTCSFNVNTGQEDCMSDLFAQLGIQLVINWSSLSAFLYIVPPLLTWLFNAVLATASVRATYKRSNESVAAGIATVRAGLPNEVSPEDLWYRVYNEVASNGGAPFDPDPLFMISLLQCGYVMLFSPAFPLAPTLAVCTNILATVLDAGMVLRRSPRPIPESASDLGAWHLIFELLSLAAVLTNSIVITLTMSALPFYILSAGDGWDARLGYFIAAETILYGCKYLLGAYLPNETSEARIQIERGQYLVEKHMLGKRDPIHDDAPAPKLEAIEDAATPPQVAQA